MRFFLMTASSLAVTCEPLASCVRDLRAACMTCEHLRVSASLWLRDSVRISDGLLSHYLQCHFVLDHSWELETWGKQDKIAWVTDLLARLKFKNWTWKPHKLLNKDKWRFYKWLEFSETKGIGANGLWVEIKNLAWQSCGFGANLSNGSGYPTVQIAFTLL